MVVINAISEIQNVTPTTCMALSHTRVHTRHSCFLILHHSLYLIISQLRLGSWGGNWWSSQCWPHQTISISFHYFLLTDPDKRCKLGPKCFILTLQIWAKLPVIYHPSSFNFRERSRHQRKRVLRPKQLFGPQLPIKPIDVIETNLKHSDNIQVDSYLWPQQFLNALEVLEQVFGNALLMTPKPSLKSLLECISQNSGLLDFNMKTEQHTETLTYIPHYPYLKKLMMPECIKLSWIQASSEKENWTPRAIYPSKLLDLSSKAHEK